MILNPSRRLRDCITSGHPLLTDLHRRDSGDSRNHHANRCHVARVPRQKHCPGYLFQIIEVIAWVSTTHMFPQMPIIDMEQALFGRPAFHTCRGKRRKNRFIVLVCGDYLFIQINTNPQIGIDLAWTVYLE